MAVLQFLFYFLVAIVVLFLTIVLGAKASWYLAWVFGTVMIVLISAAGGALMDEQEEQRRRARGGGS